MRAGRVDERDERAFGAGARLLVDELAPRCLQLRQRRVDVVHPQRDVVQARAALLDVLRDRGVRAPSPPEARASVRSDRNEMRAHALRRDLFGRLDLEAERIAIERQRRAEIFDGDADVVEDGFHIRRSSRSHEATKARDAF